MKCASARCVGTIARLLVVDDDPDLRELFCEALGATYEVTAAENGIDGLERVDRFEFDVILVDFMMPRMNGAEFVSELRRRGVTIPVVFCSTLPGVEHEAKRMGAGHFCQKPCGLARLLEVVATALSVEQGHGQIRH